MAQDTRLQSREDPKDSWTIRCIAERAIRFSILRTRHFAVVSESKALDAARQQTRQIEAFQSEGGQGG